MTPSQPEFIELAKNVSEIKAALCGDPLTGKIGIIGHHNRMLEDVYGIDAHGEPIESKKNTLLIRVSDLEDGRKKAKWLIGGGLFVLIAGKIGITAIIEKYWK